MQSPPIRPRRQLKISLPAVPRLGYRNTTTCRTSRSADTLPARAFSTSESITRITSSTAQVSTAVSQESTDRLLSCSTPASSKSNPERSGKQRDPEGMQEIVQPPTPRNRDSYCSLPGPEEPSDSLTTPYDQDEADSLHPGMPVLANLSGGRATPASAHPGVPISLESTALRPTASSQIGHLSHLPPPSFSRLRTLINLSKSPEPATQERLRAWARAEFEDWADNIRISSSVTIARLLAVSRADSRAEGVKSCAVFLRAPVVFETVAGQLWETLHRDGVEEFMREYRPDEEGIADETEGDVPHAEVGRLGECLDQQSPGSYPDGLARSGFAMGMDGDADLSTYRTEKRPEKENAIGQRKGEADLTSPVVSGTVLSDCNESSESVCTITAVEHSGPPPVRRTETEPLPRATSAEKKPKHAGSVRHISQSRIDELKDQAASKGTKGWWPRVIPQPRAEKRRPVSTLGFCEGEGMGVQQLQKELAQEAKQDARQSGSSMSGKVRKTISKVELKITRGIMV